MREPYDLTVVSDFTRTELSLPECTPLAPPAPVAAKTRTRAPLTTTLETETYTASPQPSSQFNAVKDYYQIEQIKAQFILVLPESRHCTDQSKDFARTDRIYDVLEAQEHNIKKRDKFQVLGAPQFSRKFFSDPIDFDLPRQVELCGCCCCQSSPPPEEEEECCPTCGQEPSSQLSQSSSLGLTATADDHYDDEVEKALRDFYSTSLPESGQRFRVNEKLRIKMKRTCAEIELDSDVTILAIFHGRKMIKYHKKADSKQIVIKPFDGTEFLQDAEYEFTILLEGSMVETFDGVYLDHYNNIVTQHEPVASKTMVCKDEPGSRSEVILSVIVILPKSRIDHFKIVSNADMSTELALFESKCSSKGDQRYLALASFKPTRLALYRFGFVIGNFMEIELPEMENCEDERILRSMVENGVVGYYPMYMPFGRSRTSLHVRLVQNMWQTRKVLVELRKREILMKYNADTLNILVFFDYVCGALEGDGLITMNPECQTCDTMVHELAHSVFGNELCEKYYQLLAIAESHTSLCELLFPFEIFKEEQEDSAFFNERMNNYLMKISSLDRAMNLNDMPIVGDHLLSRVERQVRFDEKIYSLAVVILTYVLKYKFRCTRIRKVAAAFMDVLTEMNRKGYLKTEVINLHQLYGKMEECINIVNKTSQLEPDTTSCSLYDIIRPFFVNKNHPLLTIVVKRVSQSKQLVIKSIKQQMFCVHGTEPLEKLSTKNTLWNCPLVFQNGCKDAVRTLMINTHEVHLETRFLLDHLDLTGPYTIAIVEEDDADNELMIDLELFHQLYSTKNAKVRSECSDQFFQPACVELHLGRLINAGYRFKSPKCANYDALKFASYVFSLKPQFSGMPETKSVANIAVRRMTEMEDLWMQMLIDFDYHGCLTDELDEFKTLYQTSLTADMFLFAAKLLTPLRFAKFLIHALMGNSKNRKVFFKSCEVQSSKFVDEVFDKLIQAPVSPFLELFDIFGLYRVSLDDMPSITNKLQKLLQRNDLEMSSCIPVALAKLNQATVETINCLESFSKLKMLLDRD